MRGVFGVLLIIGGLLLGYAVVSGKFPPAGTETGSGAIGTDTGFGATGVTGSVPVTGASFGGSGSGSTTGGINFINGLPTVVNISGVNVPGTIPVSNGGMA